MFEDWHIHSSLRDYRNGSDTLRMDIEEAAASYVITKIGNGLHMYWLPFLVPMGTLGNILSFLVMIQKRNRRISCYNHMAALALSDIAMMLNAAYYWYKVFFDIPFTGIQCITVVYTFQIFSSMSIYLILVMTFDRFLAIKFAHRAKVICTVKRARITIICLVLGVSIYSCPYILYSAIVNDFCIIMLNKDEFGKAFSWASICLTSVIPCISLFILNIMVIRAVKNRNNDPDLKADCERRGHDSQKRAEDRTKKANHREKQLAIMLLSVSVALLVLTLPQYIRYIIYSLVETTASVKTYATYILVYNITNKLYYTNNGINFYLYCLTGSKFRHDLKVLFRRGESRRLHRASVTKMFSSGSERTHMVPSSPPPDKNRDK